MLSEKYMYIAISGVVEAVSYVIPVPLLKVIGRRMCTGALFFITAAALLAIQAVPRTSINGIMVVAMVGRLCIGAAFSVIILYTSELFPTLNRNIAIGTSSTVGCVGIISAPYLVDHMVSVAWYIPSTICGVISLAAGFLVLLLPETKDKPLLDTVEQVMEKEDNRVSIKNLLTFK